MPTHRKPEHTPTATGLSMNRPPKHISVMETAFVWAEQSTCSRAQVGAVLARGTQVFATGFNGAISGVQHCKHDINDTNPCTVAVHAEKNAIAFAARHGHATEGAELYTTLAPCRDCAYLIVQSGIRSVFYHQVLPHYGHIPAWLDIVGVKTYEIG